MSEEIIEQTKVASPFDEDSWKEAPTVQAQGAISETAVQGNEAITTPEVVETKTVEVKEIPTVDYNAYLKENFGFDSVEVAKEQINKWKEFKQPEFANEESKQLFEAIAAGKKSEALSILAKQQAIENLLSAELDEKNAPQVVKLAMKEKYPTLSDAQIEYRYNKQFAMPEKPAQFSDELDSEYEQRVNSWQRQVNDIKEELLIEANISKPELEKLKSEISLKNIFGEREEVPQLSEKELQEIEATKKSHIQQIGQAINSFNSVDFEVINGEVKLPISYTLSNEEKAQMQTILSDAIENNDVNKFIGSRWFDEAGNPKSDQAKEDLFWMLNGKKVAQKLANESAAQRYEQEIKQKMNLNLNQQPQGTFKPEASEQIKKQYDAIWDA